MADNGTAASSPTVAWDDIGGVAYQRVKITFGADGTAGDVSSANKLPVEATQAGTWTVTQSGAWEVSQTGAWTVAQSGTWNIGSITTLPALVAGSAIVGKVGLDQTTPGTTNAVAVAQIGSTTVATGNGVVSAGVQRVAIASDNTAIATTATATGNVASGDVDSGNPIKVGGIVEAAPAATGLADGDRVHLKQDGRGYLWTNVGVGGQTAMSSAALADAVANTPVRLQVSTYGLCYNGSTWDRVRGDTNGVHIVTKPVTSGGLDSARVLTGTGGVIKASAGQLYSLLSVRNANAAVRYLHLYNKATAPTLSTDTPILTITLAASSVQNEISLTSIGAAFSTGIAWAYTTDNIAIPTTAGTSTELMFSAVYK